MSWVVYRMALQGKASGTNAVCVCEQGEWDAMESVNHGRRTLIKAGIPNEGEAEQFARSVPPPAPAEAGAARQG
jgi:hypothetical protein